MSRESHDALMSALDAFNKGVAEAQSKQYEPNPVPMCAAPGIWPKNSFSAWVHPSQIPEAMEAAKRRGAPTEFKPNGDAVFTSARHRKAYCENVRGIYDMDGGHADPQPKVVHDG